MVEALVIIAGALSRRLVGWGGCPRWPGLVLAAIASGVIMAPHGAFVALLCAICVPLAYGLPKHGETMAKPLLMGLRNGAFCAVMAGVLWVWHINAVAYIGAGLLVGAGYGFFYKYREALPIKGTFLDGWVSCSELWLGACLVGGLALL
mgnify:CR=1 FL=1